tara:strand:- start:70 stop:636 length:567 start_codon:yes stop_codon:yes gene_type:complete
MPSSPLEELSSAFPLRDENHIDYWNERVMDDVKNKILYIVPAGYTFSTAENIPRAYYYKSIWKKTVSMKKEMNTYPFGKDSHSILLEPEPQNIHDPYALKIKIIFWKDESTPDIFKKCRPQDIGYIPKSISKILTKNRHLLLDGKLINVYGNLQKQLFFGRIAFNYAQTKKPNEPKPNIKRFSLIMED